MRQVVDQMGASRLIPEEPIRIISLVPSQTELLIDLGLKDKVVGRTKYCIHPANAVNDIAIIGGTKNPNIASIQELEPDLIIGNKEENNKDDIDKLSKDFPVWLSDVDDLNSAYNMIAQIGQITNTEQTSQGIVAQLEQDFNKLSALNTGSKTKPINCAYLIWKKPYMTIGQDTFISSILTTAGFNNAFKHLTRYPSITIKNLQQADLDLLMLSSEPYPFKDKHKQELQSFLPNTHIDIVDGEMFSWYGSRLLKTSAYLKEKIEFYKGIL